MKKISLLILPAIIIFWSCSGGGNKKEQTQENSTAMEKAKTPALDKSFMDLSIKPGDDFYKYACGTWMKNHPIPEEHSRYSSMEILHENNLEQLQELLNDAVKNKEDKIAEKIGIIYKLGMDTAQINENGITPILPYVEDINKVANLDDLAKLTAKFHQMAMSPFFIPFSSQDPGNSEQVIAQLHQAGMGLPDRDYYLEDNPAMEEMRNEYIKHMTKMFELAPELNMPKDAAQTIMNIETRIAKSAMSRIEQRDPQKVYNKMQVSKLSELCSNFNWNLYFETLNLPVDMEINVRQVDFIKDLNTLLTDISIDDFKTYFKWELLNRSASFLNKEIEDQNFNFYSAYLSGKTKQKERWKKVLGVVNGTLGEAMGQLYVAKYFPPEAKTKMIELTGNLKSALRERISNLEWMGEDTKKEALAKLDNMNIKVGYPDKWQDYTKLDIKDDNYIANVMRASLFHFQVEMDKIGKPVDRDEWGMTPQTVNAYYHPLLNEVVFPAAILQPPFFNLDADDAVNYGAIGAVIGHEMTHGFDDQGRHYDKEGNLNNWWTEEDSKNFEKQYTPLIAQFDNFTLLDSLNVNGTLTLGENIADLGGITVALTAFKKTEQFKNQEKIDDFSPTQRFFLAYANVWKQNIRNKELVKRIKEDVHSPGEARVNATVYNIPEFYEAFDISETDKFYRSVAERIKIW